MFKDFFNLMKSEIKTKESLYKDSWKYVSIEFLEKRLLHKVEHYKLTKNRNKLISISNLCMFLHLRKESYLKK